MFPKARHMIFSGRCLGCFLLFLQWLKLGIKELQPSGNNASSPIKTREKDLSASTIHLPMVNFN